MLKKNKNLKIKLRNRNVKIIDITEKKTILYKHRKLGRRKEARQKIQGFKNYCSMTRKID